MIEAVALLVLVACIGAGILLAFMWAAGRSERAEAATSRAVNANHHALYLLVHEMHAIQAHGWQTVFPDQATFARARDLLDDYEAMIIATGPPAL